MTFTDGRGILHSLKNLPFLPKEILVSDNHKNVLRGLHQSPYAKLIYVTRGSILDFFWSDEGPKVKHLGVGESVFVPANCPHGFLSREESQIVYLLEGEFDPKKDKNIYWKSPEFPFGLDMDDSRLILSDKDRNASYRDQYDYLVLGASGFLGQNCVKHLRAQGRKVLESFERLEFPDKIRDQIKRSGAKYVVCAAGISGRPTVEWCEAHEPETYRTNYLGVLNLMEACRDLAHLTIFGSGLVYTGAKTWYTEEDAPDLESRVYCKWRARLEQALQPNVLYLRIIYPCTFDGHPKCFWTKMNGRRESVHDVSVPLTIVPSLFPELPKLIEGGASGIYNFVNEGTISLKEFVKADTAVPGSLWFGLDVTKLAEKIDVPNVKTACKEWNESGP